MQRRKFSREFKVEAVRLVRERGVSVAQAGRDLDVHENVLRKWVKEIGSDPEHAFPGHGKQKPEQLEIDRLRREVTKLKAERDILKKAAAYLVIPPFLAGWISRIYAALFSFWAGVMPPMPMLGRSLLYVQSHCVA